MPALALAIDTDDGGATDQLMAESRSDWTGINVHFVAESTLRWAGICKQEDKLRELIKSDSNEYYFATKEEIEHCGIVEGTDNLKEVIADHSFKILEETEQYLKKIRRDKGIYKVNIH